MAPRALLHLLCALGVFQKGLTAPIETQRIVEAAVGDKVCLHCQLVQTRDVLQVTWQKIFPEGEKNLATYNKQFGERVNFDLQGKMEFKDAGLQKSSIVIRRLMEEDEGCYRCSFNTRNGSLTAITCLQLHSVELHEPVLQVLKSPEEAVVSCSATGRPAPTVTLTVPHYNTTRVTNTNGTVTVTSEAVLARIRDNSTQVGCAAQVLSGPRIEVFTTIEWWSADGFDEESESDNKVWTLWITVPLVVVVCVCAPVFIWLRIKRRTVYQRDSERNKTPEKSIEDTPRHRTPLMSSGYELHQRTSAEKNKNRDHPKASSVTRRKLNFDHIEEH